MEPIGRKIALGIFAFIVVSAPLLFGTVDRIFQLALTFLLAIGMLIIPPVIPVISARVRLFLILAAAFFVGREFIPFFLFGDTEWHRVLVQNFGVALPTTHNPEPGRALDTLFALAVGGCWFLWTRTLASDRRNTPFIAWTLLASAVALALVCFLIRDGNVESIYGIRYTPGWTGYGPFPNRNHTASFLAMGALVALGCLLHAATHRQPVTVALAALFFGLVLTALLGSKSRGGLVAFAAGFFVVSMFTLVRLRSRKAAAIAIAGACIAGALVLALGANVLDRFKSGGDLPTNLRWAIWRDTIEMWRDAPLLGHGLSAFEQLFPIYQDLNVENAIVLHPESDWLQWLVEIGGLPALVAAVATGIFFFRKIRSLSINRPTFFLRIGAFGAVAVLLLHGIYDVPAHRWSIAAYGLALLGFAAPIGLSVKKIVVPKNIALVPIGASCFWAISAFFMVPLSTPTSLEKLLARNAHSTNVATADLQTALKFFPLSAQLQQAVGVRELNLHRESAWNHFRIADRLMPASWVLPASQAIASKTVSSGMALHFWSVAIERSGHRAGEIFQIAVRSTSDLPIAESFWARYAETNPTFLLSYAQTRQDESARYYFSLWWKTRALDATPGEAEIDDFYHLAQYWARPEQLDAWMKKYASREARDYKAWAWILHAWNNDAAAWKILQRHVSDPPFSTVPGTRPDVLEMRWLENSQNLLNAQALAESWFRSGEVEKCKKLVVSVAASKGAPDWFVRKAAYLEAADRQYANAVALLLR
ncbi:MAG: O-antigen ligase family protein [Verrucomicrobiota bacterium]|nr:O-antigen ligase family protein [Verrucomicrobiota bacterium]